MSATPTRTEAELRAALVAAVPVDTHVEPGLEDLRLRLDGSVAPAPAAPRRDRRWVLAVAAAIAVAVAVVGATARRADDPSPRASDPPMPATTAAPAPNDPSRPNAASLTFHAVLAVTECAAGPDEQRPDDVVPDADFVACYQVGPEIADGTDLARAEAVLQESWVVEVRAAPDAVATFNSLFNACYDADATCPPQSADGRGAVAIVFEGHVISAPAVNGVDLAADAFVISADFDQQAAEDLAAAVDAG